MDYRDEYEFLMDEEALYRGSKGNRNKRQKDLYRGTDNDSKTKKTVRKMTDKWHLVESLYTDRE